MRRIAGAVPVPRLGARTVSATQPAVRRYLSGDAAMAARESAAWSAHLQRQHTAQLPEHLLDMGWAELNRNNAAALEAAQQAQQAAEQAAAQKRAAQEAARLKALQERTDAVKASAVQRAQKAAAVRYSRDFSTEGGAELFRDTSAAIAADTAARFDRRANAVIGGKPGQLPSALTLGSVGKGKLGNVLK